MTTDKTFTLISYQQEGRDSDNDLENYGQVLYEEDQTLQQIEEAICRRLTNPSRYEGEWEFLIQYQGKAIFGTGDQFRFHATDETKFVEERAEVKARYEAAAKQAGVLTEEERQRRIKEEAEREKKYRAEQEQREFYETKRRYEQLKTKYERS